MSSTPDGLRSLIVCYYQQRGAAKDRIIASFRDRPDSQVYPVLEQALRNHEDSNLRNAAMELFVALGGRSLPPLRTLLKDADEEVRTFSSVMLGNLGERDAVPDLLEALGDPDLNVKHAVAEALGKIKDPRAVEPLMEILQSDMWLQFPAAVALGELGDSRAIPALLPLLDVPGANVPAIQALGKIGDRRALEPLCRFLEDPEPSLREWALEAVAGLFFVCPLKDSPVTLSRTAVEGLLATLASQSLKARRNAMTVLGIFKVREAAPAIAGLLPDRELREDALDALARIGGEGAVAELSALTTDADPFVRRAAAEALGALRTEQCLRAIIPLLSDPVEEVRMEAALALSRLKTGEAQRALSQMFAELSAAASEAGKKAITAIAALAGTAPATAWEFDPEDVIPLRDYIAENIGLHYDDDRLNVLHHRLQPLAASNGFRSLAEYYRRLIDQPGSTEALHRLAAQLTNNETYFFRETEQLKAFVASLLPSLRHRKQDVHKTIRILSAGCSSGEEAYTVAMMLEEAGVRRSGCGIEVTGMDIDAGALEGARQGRYTARSFRGAEGEAAKKYFRREGEWFVVDERLRPLVSFRQGNLLASADMGRFDAILCRNVLIYFSDRSVERAAQNFSNLLIPGGYLLLGHSESLCRITTDFIPLRLEGAVVYQKP